MQMPSLIGVCGPVDTVAAEAVAAEALAAVVVAAVVTAGVSEVFAVPADKNREVRAVTPPGDTAPLPPRVAGAAGVAAPTPASTMPAVSAADPAKSDRIRIATFAPFRMSRMALAEEAQSYRGTAISAHPAKLCDHDIESIRVGR
jgi:hypothetical protein